MEKLLNHSRLRDLGFVVLVLLNLFLISGAGGESGPPGGLAAH